MRTYLGEGEAIACTPHALTALLLTVVRRYNYNANANANTNRATGSDSSGAAPSNSTSATPVPWNKAPPSPSPYPPSSPSPQASPSPSPVSRTPPPPSYKSSSSVSPSPAASTNSAGPNACNIEAHSNYKVSAPPSTSLTAFQWGDIGRSVSVCLCRLLGACHDSLAAS